MAPGKGLSFASRDYWNQRFASENTPFDWLHPSSVLIEPLVDAIKECKARGNERPRILHIGCGTSLLSLQLRAHVDDPSQIWNVDFSEEAVRLGRLWEDEVVRRGLDVKDEKKVGEVLAALKASGGEQVIAVADDDDAGQGRSRTNWLAVDLLDIASITRALPSASFDIILEKSCADAIACGDDVGYEKPDPPARTLCFYYNEDDDNLSKVSQAEQIDSPQSASFAPSKTSDTDETKTVSTVHPVSLLALHLAHLATPQAHWLLLSFSEDRLVWINSSFRKPPAIPTFLRDPGELWQRTSKVQVATPESEEKNEEGRVVHRPKVYHWVFALRRR